MPTSCTGDDEDPLNDKVSLHAGPNLMSVLSVTCAEVVARAFHRGTVSHDTYNTLASYFHPTPAALVSISLSNAVVRQPVFAATNLVSVGKLQWRRYGPSTLLTKAYQRGTICVPTAFWPADNKLLDVKDWKEEYPNLGILICCPFQDCDGPTDIVGAITLGFQATSVPDDRTLTKMRKLATLLPNRLTQWKGGPELWQAMGARSLPGAAGHSLLAAGGGTAGHHSPHSPSPSAGSVFFVEGSAGIDRARNSLSFGKRSGSLPSLVSFSKQHDEGPRTALSSSSADQRMSLANNFKAHSLPDGSAEHFCFWQGEKFSGVPPLPFGELNSRATSPARPQLDISQHRFLQTFKDPALEKTFCGWHTRSKKDCAVAVLLLAMHLATFYPAAEPSQSNSPAAGISLVPMLHILAPPAVALVLPEWYKRHRDLFIVVTSASATVSTTWTRASYNNILIHDGFLALSAIPHLASHALLFDFTVAYGVRFCTGILMQLLYVAVALNKALQMCPGPYTPFPLAGSGMGCTGYVFLYQWISGGMISLILAYILEVHFRRQFVSSLTQTLNKPMQGCI